MSTFIHGKRVGIGVNRRSVARVSVEPLERGYGDAAAAPAAYCFPLLRGLR